MWTLGAVLALAGWVLKVSFLRPVARSLWALMVALGAAGTTLWLAEWSPLALQEALSTPSGRMNLTAVVTIDSLLLMAFCRSRLQEEGGRGWVSRCLFAYPGVSVLGSSCYLSSLLLLNMPGWDFGWMACVAGAVLFVLGWGGSWLSARVFGSMEHRLEGLFLTSLALLLWGVVHHS